MRLQFVTINERSENECGLLKSMWTLNAFSYGHCTIYAYLHLKLKSGSLRPRSFYPICVRLIYYKYKYSRFRKPLPFIHPQETSTKYNENVAIKLVSLYIFVFTTVDLAFVYFDNVYIIDYLSSNLTVYQQCV